MGMVRWARVRWLVALVLLAPLASAGAPFEMEFDDAVGDVEPADSRASRVDHPSADIVAFRSSVVDGKVIQRVTMASRPLAPDDSILVRSWYHNSTNGSFHVIDMEVRGDEPDPAKRFQPVRREGSFYNVSPLEATYGLDNTTWVFAFEASLVHDATCFDAGVFSEHFPSSNRAVGGMDSAYLRTARHCRTAQEPAPQVPIAPAIRVGVPTPPAGTPAPGSETPTPGLAVGSVAAAVALVAIFRTRR